MMPKQTSIMKFTGYKYYGKRAFVSYVQPLPDINICIQRSKKPSISAMQSNMRMHTLKKIVLQDSANVNVDETWLYYHIYNKKRETYM